MKFLLFAVVILIFETTCGLADSSQPQAVAPLTADSSSAVSSPDSSAPAQSTNNAPYDPLAPEVIRKTPLYANIKDTYETGITLNSFPYLIENISQNLTSVMCSALHETDSLSASLEKQLEESKAIVEATNNLLKNVQQAKEAALNRLNYFLDTWKKLLATYQKIPPKIFKLVTPYVYNNAGKNAEKIATMIYRELTNVNNAFDEGLNAIDSIRAIQPDPTSTTQSSDSGVGDGVGEGVGDGAGEGDGEGEGEGEGDDDGTENNQFDSEPDSDSDLF